MKTKINFNKARWLIVPILAIMCSTQVWGATLTVNSTNIGSFGWNTTQGSQTGTKDGITIESDNGARNSTTQMRFYSGGTHTFSSSGGYITQVDFTCTASGTNNYGPGKMSLKSGSAGSYSYSGTAGQWSGDAASFTLSGGQSRCTSIVITYKAKITFDANGGSCGTANVTQSTPTSSVSLPTPTRSGYTCNGWYTASSGGTKRGDAGGSYTPTANETLYAQWVSAGSDPTITTSVSTLSNIGYSLVDFSQVVGSFTVSGSNLTNNVTVTPNSHHEICLTENGTYQTTAIELSKGSGTLAATTIYVRMRSGKAAGSYGGNIACASSGATTKNVNTTGNVPFTIQWYANGTLYHTSYAPYATGTGSNLGDLPTPDPDPETYSCDDKTFMGWYDGTYSDASVAPEYVTTTTKINTDKTFRAVFAAEESGGSSASVTFNSSNSDGSTDRSSSIASYVASSSGISSYSGSKVYDATYGMKLATGSAAGSLTATLSSGVSTTTIVVDAKNYASDNTTLTVTVNGGTDFGSGQSPSSSGGELTFTVNSAIEVNSVTVSTPSGKRAYVKTITVGGATYSDYNTSCTVCSNEVTVSYSDPGNGNTMTVQKGSSSVSSGDALKSCSGITLTVTLTAATHYTATSLSATGVANVTTTNVGNVYTVTIPADATGTLTLTPTFTEDAYRTIVFKSNGSALFNDGGSATTFDATNKWKQKVYLTEKPVWPTDLVVGQACDADSKAFRGWVADGQTWAGKEASVPDGSTLITDASNFAAAASGSGDVVYHAVWAEASGSGSPHYAKVTSTGDITNGDYLIVYETGSVAFDGSLTTIDVSGNKISVTISTDQITANSTVNASKFTIDVTNKYIKSASNKYINKDTYGNGLAGNDAATSVHSMSIDGSGNFVVEGTGEDGGDYVTLRYNTSDNRFRFYKTGQEDVQLYKYDAGASYTNYLTTCCENYAVTLTGSGVVGGGTFSASSMQPCVGSTVELSATLCSGYTQGAWTVAKTGTPATTVTVTNNQFTMPSYAVTVSLATTAKVDHFIDRMHSTTGYTGEGASREGCNYTVPNLTNTATPVGSNCDETHYIFVGWVDSDHVGSNGALLDGYNIISGNSVQNATGTTYYAIWAQAL